MARIWILCVLNIHMRSSHRSPHTPLQPSLLRASVSSTIWLSKPHIHTHNTFLSELSIYLWGVALRTHTHTMEEIIISPFSLVFFSSYCDICQEKTKIDLGSRWRAKWKKVCWDKDKKERGRIISAEPAECSCSSLDSRCSLMLQRELKHVSFHPLPSLSFCFTPFLSFVLKSVARQ